MKFATGPVFQQYYKKDWSLNPPKSLMISNKDLIKIDEIAFKFKREKKREPSHDDLIAQMTFGFWAAFFHRKYDPVIWHRKDTFKIIFLNLQRNNRKRSYIEPKILNIKEIRNRIAHHESVINYNTSIFDVHSEPQ